MGRRFRRIVERVTPRSGNGYGFAAAPALALLLILTVPSIAAAQQADVGFVFAVDGLGTIDEYDFRLKCAGYGAAISHSRIFDLAGMNPLGRAYYVCRLDCKPSSTAKKSGTDLCDQGAHV